MSGLRADPNETITNVFSSDETHACPAHGMFPSSGLSAQVIQYQLNLLIRSLENMVRLVLWLPADPLAMLCGECAPGRSLVSHCNPNAARHNKTRLTFHRAASAQNPMGSSAPLPYVRQWLGSQARQNRRPRCCAWPERRLWPCRDHPTPRGRVRQGSSLVFHDPDLRR